MNSINIFRFVINMKLKRRKINCRKKDIFQESKNDKLQV